VKGQNIRSVRLRYTAAGALAVLVAVGAIAGTAALAAKPHVQTYGHAAMAKGGAVGNGTASKTPTAPVPGKTHTSQPGSDQPFLSDVQRLVDDGTISSTEGQALDREIQAGSVDTQTLASSGFTQAQLQPVQQMLSNTKRALAPGADRWSAWRLSVQGGSPAVP